MTPRLTVWPDGLWIVIDDYDGVSCIARGSWKRLRSGRIEVREDGRGVFRAKANRFYQRKPDGLTDPRSPRAGAWCRAVLAVLEAAGFDA